MYTEARIIKIINANTAEVSCKSDACSLCKAALFCNNKNLNAYQAKYSDISINEGDKVLLFMPPKKTVLSTMLVFGLPLLLFPLGYVLGKRFFNSNEIINALCGFVLLFFSFGIAGIVSLKNKRRLMPEITEVLSEDSSDLTGR